MQSDELEKPADSLEAGLETYFSRRYGAVPEPASDWARLAPQLGTPPELATATGKLNFSVAGEVDQPATRRAWPWRLTLVAGLLLAVGLTIAFVAFSPNRSQPAPVVASAPVAATQTKTPHETIGDPHIICPKKLDDSLDCAYDVLGFNFVTLDLNSHVNETRAGSGITQTVKYIYADANLIAIGYTVTDTTKSSFELEDSLTDANGHPLEYRGGMRGQTVNGGFGIVDTFEPPINATPGAYVYLKFQSKRVDAAGTQAKLDTAYKPLEFDLKVAYSQVKVLNLHQTATSKNGKTAILEKVVLTPGMNRFYLRGVDSSYGCVITFLDEVISTNPKEFSWLGARWWEGRNQVEQVDGMSIYYLNNYWTGKTGYEESGHWKLIIKAGSYPANAHSGPTNVPPDHDPLTQTPTDDDWVFRFTVP